MKNLFKNNVKTTAATALAAVVTVSMSFTAPLNADEIVPHPIENDISKAPTVFIPTETKVASVSRLTTHFTSLIRGKVADQNYGSLDEMKQLKLSQLDQQ